MSTERFTQVRSWHLASNRRKFISWNPHYQSVGTNLRSGGLKDQITSRNWIAIPIPFFGVVCRYAGRRERPAVRSYQSGTSSPQVGRAGINPGSSRYPGTSLTFIHPALLTTSRAFQVLEHPAGGLNYLLFFLCGYSSASSELRFATAVMLKVASAVL